jgi:hypothetical protein
MQPAVRLVLPEQNDFPGQWATGEIVLQWDNRFPHSEY